MCALSDRPFPNFIFWCLGFSLCAWEGNDDQAVWRGRPLYWAPTTSPPFSARAPPQRMPKSRFVADLVEVVPVKEEDGPSEPVSERVERHALQIGAKVSAWRLNRLKNLVHDEAKATFEEQMQPGSALDGFAHCLAIEESMYWRDWSFTAAVEYNIGACLHVLREFEEAIEWYERALETLKQIQPRWFGPILIGEVRAANYAANASTEPATALPIPMPLFSDSASCNPCACVRPPIRGRSSCTCI